MAARNPSQPTTTGPPTEALWAVTPVEGPVYNSLTGPPQYPQGPVSEPGLTPGGGSRSVVPSETPTATTVVQQLVLGQEPGAEDIKKEVEDIKQQRAAGDFSGEYGKRVYCKRHYRSMAPIKYIFMLCGRFPFNVTLQNDGTYLYKFNFFHPLGLTFLLSTFILVFTFFFGVLNVGLVVLNVTVTSAENKIQYQRQREHEEVLVQRYYIPLIFVYSSLIHCCFASGFIIYKRHYIAHYLTFWSKAVYTMHMDVSRNARGFSVRILVAYFILVISLILLASFKIGPTASGFPTVFGDLVFRLFLPKDGWLLQETNTRKRVHFFGGMILIFCFTTSKSAILFFIYHCKTLQSAFAYWNGRVYAAVLRGGEFAQTEEGRTTFKLLFKDYCILMDLMEGLDQVFEYTVESYFGCQVFSLFFELYFCIRTMKHGDNRVQAAYPESNQVAYFVRPKDWAPAGLMLLVSLIVMYRAAKAAADVGEEAMAGLEVLRRKTMLGRKTDEELYFMLSMFSSYTAYKKLEISAGGYYYMNKEFVIGLVSAVLSYFIILYQFQPVMDISYPGNTDARSDRIKYGKFLAEIEGLPEEHYETTTSLNDMWTGFRQ